MKTFTSSWNSLVSRALQYLIIILEAARALVRFNEISVREPFQLNLQAAKFVLLIIHMGLIFDTMAAGERCHGNLLATIIRTFDYLPMYVGSIYIFLFSSNCCLAFDNVSYLKNTGNFRA